MQSFTIQTFTPTQPCTANQLDKIAHFLFQHLEQYGDGIADISKAMAYAMNDTTKPGGYIFTCQQEDQIMGAVVVNRTGMDGYIPENILVYIAVDAAFRGNGIGKSLMETALAQCEGSVALHVEPDNPARKLYEKLGFENKYLEMRYWKKL